MSLKVYLKMYLKVSLNILFSAKFKVKGLEFKCQFGIKIIALEEASDTLIFSAIRQKKLPLRTCSQSPAREEGSPGLRMPPSHLTILAHQQAGLTSPDSASSLVTQAVC